MPNDIRPFVDFDIGDEVGPVSQTPTRDTVLKYADAAQINGLKFFLNQDDSLKAGLARPIVPGPLNTTFLAQMLKNFFTGWRLRTLNTTFRAPVRHGDTVTFSALITEKAEEDGIPTVYCDLLVENQEGDRAITGTAVLVIDSQIPSPVR